MHQWSGIVDVVHHNSGEWLQSEWQLCPWKECLIGRHFREGPTNPWTQSSLEMAPSQGPQNYTATVTGKGQSWGTPVVREPKSSWHETQSVVSWMTQIPTPKPEVRLSLNCHGFESIRTTSHSNPSAGLLELSSMDLCSNCLLCVLVRVESHLDLTLSPNCRPQNISTGLKSQRNFFVLIWFLILFPLLVGVLFDFFSDCLFLLLCLNEQCL